MHIRIVTTAKECAAIAQISQICFPHHSAEQFTVTQLQNMLGQHHIWAAFDDTSEEIVGYAVVLNLADDAECISLGISPKWRRQGVGTKLLQNIIQQTRGHLFMMVRSGNHKAIQLYQKLGFIYQGTQPQAYTNPCEDGLHFRINQQS